MLVVPLGGHRPGVGQKPQHGHLGASADAGGGVDGGPSQREVSIMARLSALSFRMRPHHA